MNISASGPTTDQLTHAERRNIVLGVLLPLFLGSLDQTNLAGALPTIGAEIGHVHALPWLITIYLLAATAITPLYGKLSDIHGRRVTLRSALVLYIAGSLVCALSTNFYGLLVGRALQGLGGGGLTALAMVVLGDVAAPKDRGRYYAYFSITFTTSGATGPVLGGFLAQYVHWSAIFWFNIPAGLLALFLTVVLLRRLPRHEKPHRLDIVGAVLIVVASIAFMLLLNLGGRTYPWLSAPVLGLALAAATGSLCFVWRQRTAPEPLIPLSILSNRVARCAVGTNAFGWGMIFVLNIFLPMFLQNVMGMSATTAGLNLMILMMSVNIGAGISGQLMGRVTHYKRLPTISLIVSILAILTLVWKCDDLTILQLELLLGLIGLGFGPLAPVSTVSLQNSVPPHQLGIAMGSMNFTRSLYTTMLIAACGVLVLLGGAPDPAAPAMGAAAAQANAHLVSGFRWVFAAAAVSLIFGFVCLLLMEEKPLRTTLEA
jgi:EmrB/QacA subfamily drug resistance transporter